MKKLQKARNGDFRWIDGYLDTTATANIQKKALLISRLVIKLIVSTFRKTKSEFNLCRKVKGKVKGQSMRKAFFIVDTGRQSPRYSNFLRLKLRLKVQESPATATVLET